MSWLWPEEGTGERLVLTKHEKTGNYMGFFFSLFLFLLVSQASVRSNVRSQTAIDVSQPPTFVRCTCALTRASDHTSVNTRGVADLLPAPRTSRITPEYTQVFILWTWRVVMYFLSDMLWPFEWEMREWGGFFLFFKFSCLFSLTTPPLLSSSLFSLFYSLLSSLVSSSSLFSFLSFPPLPPLLSSLNSRFFFLFSSSSSLSTYFESSLLSSLNFIYLFLFLFLSLSVSSHLLLSSSLLSSLFSLLSSLFSLLSSLLLSSPKSTKQSQCILIISKVCGFQESNKVNPLPTKPARN